MIWSRASLIALVFAIGACAQSSKKQDSKLPTAGKEKSEFLSNTHFLTQSGLRSGEGYFSADGKLMTFQSEVEATNPNYQIYIQDLATNQTKRVSNGVGKTTCSWIAPDNSYVIFSSTHSDPESLKKQEQDLAARAAAQGRSYAWDYDENYEIYKYSLEGKELARLTNAKGYDAEGSISPDGKWLVFSSNRAAYQKNLSADEAALLGRDPSYFLDLYVMKTDGSNLRRLTSTPGYEGGPFFSPDGGRIIFRRFSPDGRTAEVFTIGFDGKDEKQLTRLNAMSWAPFYHPSGDYVIFTTSVFGHKNFELFMVDTNGTKEPVRVTEFDGFDGLPVFTPDGKSLTWNRKFPDGKSQIMIADWNDAKARAALGLGTTSPKLKQFSPQLSVEDTRRLVEYLASASMKGRATGSPAEDEAQTTIENYFRDLKLAGPFQGKYRDPFEFNKEAQLGMRNELTLLNDKQETLAIDQDWRPLAFSQSGEVAATPLVFAGYGLRVAGKGHGDPGYDSYGDLDVKDKWVVILRYWPEGATPEKRAEYQRYSRLEHKASLAKSLGARGVIFVSGPNSKAKEDLIRFNKAVGSDIGLPAISISDKIAASIFNSHGLELKAIQSELDSGKRTVGMTLEKIRFSASVSIRYQKGTAHNVAGWLRIPGAQNTVVIGAHGDHLGEGPSESSLATNKDRDMIHYGADDNASGVAAVLELAHSMTDAYRSGTWTPKQNVLFVVWSGEELGNLGSSRFTQKWLKTIRPSAYINMDMIGRWETLKDGKTRKALAIQGVGSSDDWRLFEKLQIGAPIQYQQDPYLPTDAMSFYVAKVPVISFFSGAHSDYHTPRDTADKINHWGIVDVANIVSAVTTEIAKQDKPLTYRDIPKTAGGDNRRGFRIYLGTIPDYSGATVKGVRLSGVVSGGPAEKAGLQSGDIIIEFASRKIENIHDYVMTLEGIRPEEKTPIVVLRAGEKRSLEIVPAARE